MKRLMATLVLGLVAPCLAFGQTYSQAPDSASFPGARHKLMQQQRASMNSRIKNPLAGQKKVQACEPGPVQGFYDIPGGWSEGIAVAHNGDIYTADLMTNNVYRITPKGEASLFTNLYSGTNYDPNNPFWYFDGPKGLGFSGEGDLWVCNPNPNSKDLTKHGLWKVNRHGRCKLAVPLDPDEVPFPNGLTFDPRGNLYFTESWNGGVWKVERGQSVATIWSAHNLLAPAPGGFGANGIVYKEGSIFVANSDQVTLVKIPMNHDGSAGTPAIFAAGFGWPDGLTMGPSGDLYAIGGWDDWQLIRFADDGTWEIAVPNGMTGTASLEFGKTHGDKNTVYMSNFGSSWDGLPSLLKVELCKPSHEKRTD